MKILFCSSEVVPYAKTGGLADVSHSLPLALSRLGQQVEVVTPRYRQTDIRKFGLTKVKDGLYRGCLAQGVGAYLIDNKELFGRQGLYGTRQGDYEDNLERFSFFCRRSIELMKEADFRPDLVHCNDWQSAPIIIYLKSEYKNDPFYKGIKTVFTIHNLGFQGIFGDLNLLKDGITLSDVVNTVSPTYAREILTKDLGFGLEDVLNKRKESLFGVLNGIDYGIWDPAADSLIVKKYSRQDLKNKYENKRHLIKICSLKAGADAPLLGMVSRLTSQKGMDILIPALDEAGKWDAGIVILGQGEAKYHGELRKLARKYKGKISVHFKFDESLAHKIYAGSDIFLMPSRYEPCGLSQMISLKYGAMPLVFKTGGLADTVTLENGFVFVDYSKEALLKAMLRACSAHKDKDHWLTLVRKGMLCDFSWEKSAAEYIKLYQRAVNG